VILMFVIVVKNHLFNFQGKGRAFCAGGDVSAGVQSVYNDNYISS
jgi:enoyl-CoA hydratase/carnithine racemase